MVKTRADSGRASASEQPGGRLPVVVWIRRIALGAYLAVFAVSVFTVGVPIGRDRVLLWTVGALLVASIGRSWRAMLQLIADWAIFAAVLVAYDYSRGAADTLGMPVQYRPQLLVDRWLFLGNDIVVELQEWLYDTRIGLRGRPVATGPVQWYEVVFDVTYVSHYLVSFVLAAVLWAKNRDRFVRFARRFGSLSFLGFLTYALFPAAPPWLAARRGHLPATIGRVGGRGFDAIRLDSVRDLVHTNWDKVNVVAAVPSLHAGFATLVAITLWGSVPRPVRPLLVLYPVVMGVALVATGEHYVSDILLGAAYAFIVHRAWGAWERHRAARVATTNGPDRTN